MQTFIEWYLLASYRKSIISPCIMKIPLEEFDQPQHRECPTDIICEVYKYFCRLYWVPQFESFITMNLNLPWFVFWVFHYQQAYLQKTYMNFTSPSQERGERRFLSYFLELNLFLDSRINMQQFITHWKVRHISPPEWCI